MCILVNYGKSGDIQANKNETEDFTMPTIIMGDFKLEPKETQSYGEMLDEGWTDIGENANRLEKQPNLPTCWSIVGAKPSRIDGMIACPKALLLIHDFNVIRKEEIPTHAIVKIVVS